MASLVLLMEPSTGFAFLLQPHHMVGSCLILTNDYSRVALSITYQASYIYSNFSPFNSCFLDSNLASISVKLYLLNLSRSLT